MSADSVIDQASERPEIDPGDRFQRRRPGGAGLVFPARVRVTGSRFNMAALGDVPASRAGPAIDPVEALLTPGMTASVEIKTGQRSVLSFLLSPIARSVSEAGRER